MTRKCCTIGECVCACVLLKTKDSNLHGFQHRPSSKGTKLLFIKAIINQYQGLRKCDHKSRCLAPGELFWSRYASWPARSWNQPWSFWLHHLFCQERLLCQRPWPCFLLLHFQRAGSEHSWAWSWALKVLYRKDVWKYMPWLSKGTHCFRSSDTDANLSTHDVSTLLGLCCIDWCCFYHFVRNSLVALLEALCAQILSLDSWISAFLIFVFVFCVSIARSLTKPFFRPSQPGSCAWPQVVAIPLVCWLYMCVCVCVPLYDDDCFYYHSWRNNVVIAFGTLSSVHVKMCR